MHLLKQTSIHEHAYPHTCHGVGESKWFKQHGTTFSTASISDAEPCVVSCLSSEANRTLTGWVSHVEVGHPHPASLSSTVGPLHVAVDMHSRAIGSLDLLVA